MPPIKNGKWWLVLLAILILVGVVVLTYKPVGEVRPEAVELCNIGWDNAYGVIGHDGAYSIVLPDGRRFWSFADTWIGEIADGRRKITADLCLHSTGAIQRGE